MEESNRAVETVVWSWKQKVYLRLTNIDVDGKMSF